MSVVLPIYTFLIKSPIHSFILSKIHFFFTDIKQLLSSIFKGGSPPRNLSLYIMFYVMFIILYYVRFNYKKLYRENWFKFNVYVLHNVYETLEIHDSFFHSFIHF